MMMYLDDSLLCEHCRNEMSIEASQNRIKILIEDAIIQAWRRGDARDTERDRFDRKKLRELRKQVDADG